MDSSREQDLYYLHRQMHDASLPMFERRLAYKTYCVIKKQLEDRKLTDLREKLVRATQEKDKYWIWKYQSQIKEYLKEDKLERVW